MTDNVQNTSPLVSFIITAYNLPTALLRACIDSILSLSLRPSEREIILVDDGSAESPISALTDLGDELVYVRQRNGGVSVARNTALRMATGRYVQIVDGDDLLIQAPYEHCLDIVRYNADADVVVFDFTRDDGEDGTQQVFDTPVRTSGAELLRTQNIRGAVWCLLFRQATRGQLTFTPGIAYGEDEAFTPQLLIRAETVYTTTAKAYYYRRRDTSATGRSLADGGQQRLDDSRRVILHLQQIADTLPQNERIAMQRRVAQLTMDLLYNNIMQHRSLTALEALIETLRKDALFPLPDRDYSRKYSWFRRLTESRMGRRALIATLPLMKRER